MGPGFSGNRENFLTAILLLLSSIHSIYFKLLKSVGYMIHRWFPAAGSTHRLNEPIFGCWRDSSRAFDGCKRTKRIFAIQNILSLSVTVILIRREDSHATGPVISQAGTCHLWVYILKVIEVIIDPSMRLSWWLQSRCTCCKQNKINVRGVFVRERVYLSAYRPTPAVHFRHLTVMTCVFPTLVNSNLFWNVLPWWWCA